MTTATEIAGRIRRGEVTSRAVTEDVLARIADDDAVNAIVETRAEFALRAADAADAAIAEGRAVGPLHGVPMTIKECFNVAGMRTTWGNPAFAEYVADRDATVVERLSRAGAIIVGKSNVHTMLADFGQTSNEIYGRTNNPADLTRTPGGSSGGGAAATGRGTELPRVRVGPRRVDPAARGVLRCLRAEADHRTGPTAGIPGAGPAGTAERVPELVDNRTTRAIGRGPADGTAGDRRAGGAVLVGASPSRRQRLADFRVGVVSDHAAAPVSSEVGAVLSETIDRLGRSGAKIVEGWPDGVDPEEQAEAFGSQVELFFALHGGAPSSASLAEVIEQERRRMVARQKWQQYFEDVDVFLCPTSFTAAFPHDDRPFEERTIRTSYGEQRYDAQAFWIAHASLIGHPALSMPIGQTPDGLPVGAQVIGPWHEDDTAITFAELLAA